MAVCLGGGLDFGAECCARTGTFLTAPERATGGAFLASCRFSLFCFFTLPRSHPVLAQPVFRRMQQQPGLSAATRPFAKVRLQSDVEGKIIVVVVFFCHNTLLTPCPRLCLSLLVNATIAGDVGRWFAGRDNIVITKVSLVLLLYCSSNLAHALLVPAQSHTYCILQYNLQIFRRLF